MQLIRIFHLYIVVSMVLSGYAYAQSTVTVNGFVSDLVPPSPNQPTPPTNNRFFSIYLPDGYDPADTATRYPTIYACPGLGGDYTSFAASSQPILDSLISSGLIMPLIVIFTDPSLITGVDPTTGLWSYDGSWYVNSELNGQFETYMIDELIPFVDGNYNTMPEEGFRAIMGQSMGAFGASYLGMRHPDVFCAFAGASVTAFWDIDFNTDPYDAYTLNAFILPEIPTSGPGAGKIAPTNGGSSSNTFSVFSYAAAFSPNLTSSTDFVIAYSVDMPFMMNGDGTPVLSNAVPGGPPYPVGNIKDPCGTELTYSESLVLDPTITAKWASFDPYDIMDSYISTLQNQLIYIDSGDSEVIDNVGARQFSDKLSASLVDHEYILYVGDHTACLITPDCSRYQTIFQLFSAKFAEAGNPPNTIRTKIVGTGTIDIQNGTWAINKGTIVGIETSPSMAVTDTNIAINIGDNGNLLIGNYTTPGGALQIGDNYGKAILQGDPALANDTVYGSITLDGTNAVLQIGQQGFLGLGMGMNGQAPTVPNFFSVSNLTNVQNIALNLTQGTWIMNQIPNGQNTNASILGLGSSASYTLTIDPTNVIIQGGSSHVMGTDMWNWHPTLISTTDLLASSGILTNIDDDPTAVDCFYEESIGSTLYYTEELNRNVIAASQEYNDRLPAGTYTITTSSITEFSNYLSTLNYLSQVSKEGALTVNGQNNLVIAYVDNNVIQLVPTAQADVGVHGSVNFNRIAQTTAVVGVWVETINGQRQLVLVYDVNPPQS